MRIKTLSKKAKKSWKILKKDGLIVLMIIGLEKLRRPSRKIDSNRLLLPVDYDDAIKVDFTKTQPHHQPKIRNTTSYILNWVMSPPGPGSGGHQNLFRFIDFLEKAGHKCRIYLYTTTDTRSMKSIERGIAEGYPKLKAPMEWLRKDRKMEEADGIFATGWETAYPVFNSPNKARRFYFVQDFEPYFYPIGSEYVLAENTYRFNFFGITAGGWLSKRLAENYGMKTDSFEFGADSSLYKFNNSDKRKEIFFYARPVTARRAFELGVMALDIFHQKHPEYIINMAGWDVSNYNLPFPYKNLKTLKPEDLPEIYNKCAAALVMSLTNLSLLPIELLSCGTIPVVNDGENNRLVSNNKFIAYTPNNPVSLANKLSEVVTKQDLPSYAKKASESASTLTWQESGKKFVNIVEREVANG